LGVRNLAIASAVLGLAALLAVRSAGAQEPHNYAPPNGLVPDEATAVIIAEAVLTPVYGQKQIRSEEPFHATLEGGTWKVRGSLHCERLGGGPHDCVGGVAEVDIAKRDGRVTRLTHSL
jgi:hypothetical protein